MRVRGLKEEGGNGNEGRETLYNDSHLEEASE